jgi:hypothetical protein
VFIKAGAIGHLCFGTKFHRRIMMRVERTLPFVFVCFLGTALAPAPRVFAPEIQPGDAWVMVGSVETHNGNRNGFRQTRQRLTVTGVEGDRLQVSVQAVGSPLPPNTILRGRDWSNYIDVAGSEILSAQPMNFPLYAGKRWKVAYENTTPSGDKYSSIRIERDYVVVDYAPVSVAGVAFQSYKIEMNGRWTGRLAQGGEVSANMYVGTGGSSVVVEQQKQRAGSQTGGRLYSLLWYAPAQKHWVKLLEETYGSAGVLTEKIDTELERFYPASSSRVSSDSK